MIIKTRIEADFIKILQKLNIPIEMLYFEHPALADHGDFSTNIAMSWFRKVRETTQSHVGDKTKMATSSGQFNNPVELASFLVNEWRSGGVPDYIAHIEVVNPGFINVWLDKKYLLEQLETVLKEKDRFGSSDILKNKKILLEHTSPNPQTTIMFGHLRNNFIGMSLSRLLEFNGAKVTKDEIINDRGVHLCRSMFGYLVFAHKTKGFNKTTLKNFREVTDKQITEKLKSSHLANARSNNISWKDLLEKWSAKKTNWFTPDDLNLKPDHANLIWYVLGSRAYEMQEKIKKQVSEILQAWEEGDENVRKLWTMILRWSDDGYAETYKRVGSKHDWVWRESDHYQKGKDIVTLGLKRKVFKKSEGAIVTNLVKYNLSDTVVVKSDGTALYFTQDLALVRLKKIKFPSDLFIWVVGSEQMLYFKQLFAVADQLGIINKEKTLHLPYGLVNFKGGGKMSTRKGNVVMADEILDELEQKARDIIKNTNQDLRKKTSVKELDHLVTAISLSAIKYGLLRYDIDTTVAYDIDESLSLKGNSGPYVQYTYARCRSVLEKAKESNFQFSIFNFQSNQNFQFSNEELILLRHLYLFPEIIHEATEKYAPNLITNYLYSLAQEFNLFYDKHSILNAPEAQQKEFRLCLTAAMAQVIKNGLTLLGIEVVEKM